jgi:hypothetical protein
MNNEAASVNPRWSDPVGKSLDTSDADPLKCYCPTRLLSAFALLMAGHGHCVNTTMMLGDREYAMWQLARARTLGDAELRDVAARLLDYFNDPRTPAPEGLAS